MHVYCLFCLTQKCHAVASALERQFEVRAFAPQICNRQRVQGKNIDKLYDLLPGYVFVFSDKALANAMFYRENKGVIRRLGSPVDDYELTGADKDFAMKLYDTNGIVEQIKIFRVGESVCISNTLFDGCDAKITRIDHRNQRARIEYKFAGMQCFTWIACDMISEKPSDEVREG